MADAPASDPLASLRGHWYIKLTTYRKSGSAVATPVWFAVADGKVYVGTPADSGKVKRIRNNPRVRIAACTARGRALGPAIEAIARVLPPGEQGAAKEALHRKYGLRTRFFRLLYRLRRRERALLEIVPA